MDIGKRLSTLRDAKGLSQSDIAERAGFLRCYISRVENGYTVPSLGTLQRWARALEVEVYQLFFDGDGVPVPVPAAGMSALDRSEEKLLSLYRRANRADRKFMLDVGRKLTQMSGSPDKDQRVEEMDGEEE